MKNKQKNEDLNFLKLEIERSKLLLEISRKIASLKNLSEILWTIVDFVTQKVGADRGTLFLNDNETNEVIPTETPDDIWEFVLKYEKKDNK